MRQAEELRHQAGICRGLRAAFCDRDESPAGGARAGTRHRGVLMGRVACVNVDSVVIETNEVHAIAPLKEGDGLVFDAADWRSPGEPEEGGRVYQASQLNGRKQSSCDSRIGRFGLTEYGLVIWYGGAAIPKPSRLRGRSLRLRHRFARQQVRIHVTAREGRPLVAEWSLPNQADLRVTVKSPAALGVAQHRSVSIEYLRDQFGRLGNTPYELAEVLLDVEDRNPFAPVSLLNQMRREAVEKLQDAQITPHRNAVRDPATSLSVAIERRRNSGGTTASELHLLVRTPDQLAAAIEIAPASITLDYLDLYGLRPSVERVKAAGIVARVAESAGAETRGSAHCRFLLSLNCQILVRATGILHSLKQKDHPFLIGDFSLNTANSLSAVEYLKLVSRLTPGHDLNAAQVADLARNGCTGEYRGHCLPAFARFSHRALRVLPLPLRWPSYKDCAQAVRKASRRIAGSGRQFTSRNGGCGLPEYGIRRRSAGRQRTSRSLARSGHPAFPPSSSSTKPASS